MEKMSICNYVKTFEDQILRMALKKKLAEAHQSADGPTRKRSSSQQDDVQKQSEIKEDFPSDHHDWSPTLKQDGLKPLLIKEEEEEADITDLTVIVKSEDEEEKIQHLEPRHIQSKENSNSVRRSDLNADQYSGSDTSDFSDDAEDDTSSSSDNIEDDRPDFSNTDISNGNWRESIDHQSDLNSVNSEVNKLYKCTTCSITFDSEANLLGHKKIHSEYRLFSCSVCKATFTMKYLLVEHTRIHTREKPFSCSVCGQSFVKGKNWTRHMRYHAMEAPFRNLLIQHMKTHGEEKPFHCAECGQSCSGNSHLAYHMACGRDGGLFICSVCKASFKWKKVLLNKDTRASNEVKPFTCGVCDVTFKTCDSLIKHSRCHAEDKVRYTSHSREKLFGCSICKNFYKKKVNLVKHMKRHTRKKPSNICPPKNSQHSGIKTHWQHYRTAASKAAGHKRKPLN